MSGICGVARFDGSPVDAPLLERMTTGLMRQGPDARSTWHGTQAGLGHTLLDTTDGTMHDSQPCTLDGRRWIVADARIDGRGELLAALAAAGERVDPSASDAILVLHAWNAWGEACPERLLGDFAFAIWDADRSALFCARDHLGIKPFFYARAAGSFLFANSLACLRAQACVADELDEAAIGDFLLFEMSQEASATVFAAIRRLPPAHCLLHSPEGLRIRRYWRLPSEPIANYPRDSDYLERFDEVLHAAVADRIRSPKAAILMSGGLDSPALASVAARSGTDVRAYASVYDSLFADEERKYSTLAASGLQIPIAHRVADGYGLFERYSELRDYFCEPVNAPFAALDVDLAADAGRHARVVLTGWDGDTLLAESPRPFLANLARQGHWGALAAGLARYALHDPRAAARSAWLRLRPRVHAMSPAPFWPLWLDEDFSRRLRLRERWSDVHFSRPPAADPLRPHAHRVFDYLARLSSFFEPGDPARTGVAAEMRHPFMDLRVVSSCLALPPIPWCIRKEILRRWLRGRVPEAVRLRPKAPLAGFPHMAVLQRPSSDWLDGMRLSRGAARFIDQGKMTSIRGEADPAVAWANLRPASLDLWLRHANP